MSRPADFRRIMVPLDGSRLAESVLPMVTLLARDLGAQIWLLHVVEERPPQAVHGEPHLTSAAAVLELKDRLPKVHGPTAIDDQASAPVVLRDDVLSALMNLGYHRPLAEKAVESAIKATVGGDFERTLKQALRELAR